MVTGGVFKLLANDGKTDRMISADPRVLRKWEWGDRIEAGRCVIVQENDDPHIYYGVLCCEVEDDYPRNTNTYLGLLPRDIRHYILRPMCNFCVKVRLITFVVDKKFANAEAAGQFAALIRESGCDYPCSIWDAIVAVASR